MNFNRPLILASKSPRRQQLLKDAGFEFQVITKDVDESFPVDMPAKDVAAYLSKKKTDAFNEELKDQILITADTVVKVDEEILNKPSDFDEAMVMLKKLSNRSHEVITGFTLKSSEKQFTYSDTTVVHFKKLTKEEIEFYITNFKPFDKAGAYGIQEWIGMIGITKIEGSYFNVVGLPVQLVYEKLKLNF